MIKIIIKYIITKLKIIGKMKKVYFDVLFFTTFCFQKLPNIFILFNFLIQ
jgi:hypothetical protein